ncbi:GNAT family N-acetyltransferase [Hydrogenoanaerobacterium sp.]|uniref:GNAT family N-acetyltransferase n=1 Tax=Hydrogenoanaerobacterium sp. TaxID=2953763 RepID=UPI0028997BBF|nr:GNAT family N-acetyltransferase [Hydrogenoanaerobacterium sp.]
MNIEIKRATVGDADAISKIHAASWKKAYRGIIPQKYLDDLKDNFWVPAFEDWIGNEIFTVYLICADDVPIGCTAYGKARDSKMPNWGEIVSVYMHPDYYGKGYGRRLFDFVLSCIKQDGYRNCYLWVLKENLTARRFYEKSGFCCSQDEYISEIMGKQIVDVRYVFDFE